MAEGAFMETPPEVPDDGYSDADLAPHGWRPGDYMGPCRECAGSALGAKRVRVCRSCAVKALVAARAVTPEVPEPVEVRHTTPSGIVVEFRQHDWLPGFAAYLFEEGKPFPNGQAFCALNLDAFLGSHVVAGGTPAELVESLADTMVHEVCHVLEAWAGVEFSEARVEELIARYRGHASTYESEADAGMDFSAALYLARTEGARIRRKGSIIKLHIDGGHMWANEIDVVGLDFHLGGEDLLAEDWEVLEAEPGPILKELAR